MQFALPAVWVGLARRRTLAPPAGANAGCYAGLLLGVTVVAGMLLMYFLWLKPANSIWRISRHHRAKANGFGMGSKSAFIAGAVLARPFHALEEYYWRWFVFGGCGVICRSRSR